MKPNLPELRNCRICNHEMAPDLIRQMLEKKIASTEVCAILQCTGSNLRKHIQWHMASDVAAFIAPGSEELALLMVDRQGELVDSMERTKKLIEQFSTQMSDEGKLDANDLRAYASLEKLLGDNIQLMAKLTGDLTSGAMIQVNNYKIQIGKLTEGLVGILCEKCQEPVLKLITSIENGKNAKRTDTDL